MRSSEPAFHSDALKRVEAVYRRQLTQDPADAVARVGLAWCLFMLALLQAGQESVVEALLDPTAGEHPPVEETAPAALGPNAAELLEDCLRQTLTVKQLTSNAEARVSAERILSLVRLSGGGRALGAAEERAARVLNDVAREVLEQDPPRRGRLRRRPTGHSGQQP